MTPKFSVSGFLAVVNQTLEVAFPTVEIEGEVAGFKVNHQKYVFFDLKGDDGTVGCFMTVWQLRTAIEDGMKVVVRAAPKLTPWGKFSLTVQEVRPVGEGNLKKSFELLKKKLAAEGLFDEGRKRPLPTRPNRVAVVSSTQAAGYADFMKIAAERWGGVKFLVCNVQVQGETAADQMIEAIRKLEQLPELPEVIVLIRGGGSADDLGAYNDELLVRAVAASRVPVLTGIGHETDESLVDLAADVRASTPSNAAQVLLPDKHETVRLVRHKLLGAAQAAVRAIDERLVVLAGTKDEALAGWAAQIDGRLGELRAKRALIDEYDPELVLARGYAIIKGEQKVGAVVELTTKKAIMKARIEAYDKR